MFEKDLYALIRGLRNHKGTEKEYIQDSIKECRKEIRGQDMDQKTTALLKLIYLEMFGHDMSWASFNVLEVMSSQKYMQKRVGYLGAVQSFRPDTEVLMLGENLLKKDLTSPYPTTISLPLITIPHVVNPSMANSLLADLLPRLSHSHAAIRKKTIVTLYRLALVYPETLRPAWPKIKERLLDENEDSSVTAAIVNVICELGWRRPQDFLPLAPRLFELLVQGGNNWMAIKIIKLFAILTPLEPRLVKKLLSPLTTLIKTTPAMSLLYECINGIIQGGILEGAEGTTEGDEIARLCVSKLRGMLVAAGDPNLKYVGLLAFTRIVASHPQLVAQHSDVILECIDDLDISIRTRALELMGGMVDQNNLVPIVERLLRQLRDTRPAPAHDQPDNDRAFHEGVIPAADSDDEDAEESLRQPEATPSQPPPLPDEYRISVINKILDLCSAETYANVNDFEWYIGVLVELVRYCPAVLQDDPDDAAGTEAVSSKPTVAGSIGHELMNVAVRVRSVRPDATAAAQSLLIVERRKDMFPASGTAAHGVLGSAAWIAGEYADLLPDADAVLTSLVHSSTAHLPPAVLSLYLHSVPKVFVRLTSKSVSWTPARRSHVILLTARVIHFLEPLVLHPKLEVQERAVEYLELIRLASEAATGQAAADDVDGYADSPLLLTQAIPALFTGLELNPMAPGALRKVQVDAELDLDQSINPDLQMLLQNADAEIMDQSDEDEAYKYYNEQPVASVTRKTASESLETSDTQDTSYQQQSRAAPLDAESIAKLKAERRERYRDDPFYIDPEKNSGTSTPLHNILESSNGNELDIDSIPIMDLQLERTPDVERPTSSQRPTKRSTKRVEIAADETIDGEDAAGLSPSKKPVLSRGKKSLLEVDSSGLSALSLADDNSNGATQLDIERREAEEEEMARAIKEVERKRLEMQRAQERIEEPEEGVMVKRKKKKKPRVELLGEEQGDTVEDGGDARTTKKKKKKKKVKDEQAEQAVQDQGDAAVTAKPKRKKKREVTFEEDQVSASI